MKYENDQRIVLTLDAGGTNFVFNAIQGYESISESITYPAEANNLKKCLHTISQGFNQLKRELDEEPTAISFAFPGPADYKEGVIGDLPNLPAFDGSVALGPYLEREFQLPVFINNDGNLFAYGEALVGYLPEINARLRDAGSAKQYRNLVGFTLGTGFGAGIVHNGELIIGDNSNAGEVWIIRDFYNPDQNVEESISIRAVQRKYMKRASRKEAPSPKAIYEIAIGKREGHQLAARQAFQSMGRALGEIANIVTTLFDGIIVIGGGVSGAGSLFLPAMLEVMNGSYNFENGKKLPRLVTNNYNLENQQQLAEFIKGKNQYIKIFESDQEIKYDAEKRIGVGISKIGTSQAVAAGAYAFALNELDKRE